MSFRGGRRSFGGRQNFGGSNRSGPNRGRGGGRWNTTGGNRNFDQGPPDRVIPLGYFDYMVQDDLVVKVEIEDVPFFNAPIYLENKEQIGKIDEIFGNLRDYSVTVRLGEHMKADSFARNQKLFIDPAKLLPIQRFLPKPPGMVQKQRGKRQSSGGGRDSHGGRGDYRGGRGYNFRGGQRGGSARGNFRRGNRW